VTVMAERLPPGQEFQIVWVTAIGTWKVTDTEYHGRDFAPVAYEIARVKTDSSGRFAANFIAPDDCGLMHDVVLQQGSRLCRGIFHPPGPICIGGVWPADRPNSRRRSGSSRRSCRAASALVDRFVVSAAGSSTSTSPGRGHALLRRHSTPGKDAVPPTCAQGSLVAAPAASRPSTHRSHIWQSPAIEFRGGAVSDVSGAGPRRPRPRPWRAPPRYPSCCR
jgi:hypothetical protein